MLIIQIESLAWKYMVAAVAPPGMQAVAVPVEKRRAWVVALWSYSSLFVVLGYKV